MVEIGIVKSINGAKATVEFSHLETTAECLILQISTGARTIAGFPSEGTQVACWLGDSCNLVLGAIFSAREKATAQADFTVDVDGLVDIRNNSTSLSELLKGIYDTMKTLVMIPGPPGSFVSNEATNTTIEAKKLEIKNLIK